jgi:hypothetical protein
MTACRVSAPERNPALVTELTVLACPVSARERERAPVSARRPEKRASAIEVVPECPHPRSAWAKPNHTGQGTDNDNQPRTKTGPLTRVVASGRPSEAEGASRFSPHPREVCPPGRASFVVQSPVQHKQNPPLLQKDTHPKTQFPANPAGSTKLITRFMGRTRALLIMRVSGWARMSLWWGRFEVRTARRACSLGRSASWWEVSVYAADQG